MAKWLLMVETECNDAARESEFNEWYNKIHLPDVLETPGFIGATRYERPEPLEGKPKFLATYEIETDDLNATMKALRNNLAQKKTEGRYSELVVIVSQGVYRQIESLPR